jgi:hypothetical protein
MNGILKNIIGVLLAIFLLICIIVGVDFIFLNKNEDKTWSLNCAFINQVGKQYQTQRAQYLNKLDEPKGHSLILHILFGGFVFWIPAIYITCSKNHYWHL